MIHLVNGDMFESGADILVNTVNCVGVMGKGVALEFKKRYPALFSAYKRYCSAKHLFPGGLFVWDCPEDGKTIVCLATKDHWRNPSEYEWIKKGLFLLKVFLEQHGKIKVAIPPLGCGCGGLNWEVVRGMITQELSDLKATILIYEPIQT